MMMTMTTTGETIGRRAEDCDARGGGRRSDDDNAAERIREQR
jgi:hypothetical protein